MKDKLKKLIKKLPIIILISLLTFILFNFIYLLVKIIFKCNLELSIIISLIIDSIILIYLHYKRVEDLLESITITLIYVIIGTLYISTAHLLPYQIKYFFEYCERSEWFSGIAYAIYLFLMTYGHILILIVSKIALKVKNHIKKPKSKSKGRKKK